MCCAGGALATSLVETLSPCDSSASDRGDGHLSTLTPLGWARCGGVVPRPAGEMNTAEWLLENCRDIYHGEDYRHTFGPAKLGVG